MPQGKRKVPFSGKAKKEQLKAKRHAKDANSRNAVLEKSEEELASGSGVQKINFQPNETESSRLNKYALHFYRESNEEIRERKELARQSLVVALEETLNINVDDFFPKELNFPKRPPWSFNMTRDEVEMREHKYFTEYVNNIEKNFSYKDLSFFEMNLETWRQLWRVLEMSDIILYVVDIRFPALMFPPSLYEYVVKELQKDFILVLNKIDLAPASLVVAWQNYFKEKYPELHISMFTTLPSYNLIGKQSNRSGLQVRRRRGRIRMAAEGTQLLFDLVKTIVNDAVDLSSWENKIAEEMHEEYEDDAGIKIGETINLKRVDTSYFQPAKFKDGVLTIGCIGYPNVGKSSLLNAVMGRKVVSVSKTPGHTKHFQTIFVTSNVKLCDCPGLVFPSKVPKVLQVLMGSFPIAQLREPYTTIKYIAERLDLPQLLRIDHPDNDDTWSAMDICDGWAKKRGFYTAKAARLDSYRAANHLLRMALDGKICLCLFPPGYVSKKDCWARHPDIDKVKWIQAKCIEDNEIDEECELFSDSDIETSRSSIKNESDHNTELDTEDTDEDKSVVQETSCLSVNKFDALCDL